MKFYGEVNITRCKKKFNSLYNNYNDKVMSLGEKPKIDREDIEDYSRFSFQA